MYNTLTPALCCQVGRHQPVPQWWSEHGQLAPGRPCRFHQHHQSQLSQCMAEHLCPADKIQEASHQEAAFLVLLYEVLRGGGCALGERTTLLPDLITPRKVRVVEVEPPASPLHSNHNALCLKPCVINNKVGRWSYVPSASKASGYSLRQHC